MEWLDKAIFHASGGRPSDIAALEKRRTFVEFMSILNNHLEITRKKNAEIEKQNKQNS